MNVENQHQILRVSLNSEITTKYICDISREQNHN